MINIGLQTFTVKKLMRNFAAMDATFAELEKLGIKAVELAAEYLYFKLTPESALKVRETAAKHGITIFSVQIKYKHVMEDFDRAVAIMKNLGSAYMTISVIDLKLLMKGEVGVIQYCDNLNALRERLIPLGITLGHHNHHFEFLRMGGKNALEIIAERFKGELVLDTYWIQRGGGNHLVLLNKLAGRVTVMHLRDYKIKYSGFDLKGSDAEIGLGNLPFKEILAAASAAGVKYGMIEQSSKKPLKSITTSISNLKIL